MRITKRRLRKIIRESIGIVAQNIDLHEEDDDLQDIAEHFGYQQSSKRARIGAWNELPPDLSLGPKEYRIQRQLQQSGTFLYTPNFSVSKYYNFGRYMFSVRIKGQRRDMYLGPMRSVEKVIEYLENNLLSEAKRRLRRIIREVTEEDEINPYGTGMSVPRGEENHPLIGHT